MLNFTRICTWKCNFWNQRKQSICPSEKYLFYGAMIFLSFCYIINHTAFLNIKRYKYVGKNVVPKVKNMLGNAMVCILSKWFKILKSLWNISEALIQTIDFDNYDWFINTFFSLILSHLSLWIICLCGGYTLFFVWG